MLINYQEKPKKLLNELENHIIIGHIGKTHSYKSIFGTTFSNPLIFIPEGDIIKVVLDKRHLNSSYD